MPAYSVATGHGHVFSETSLIVPEPSGQLIAPVQREYSWTGAVHDRGQWCVLRWDFLETEAAYAALLLQFGLDEETFSPVTVYLRNNRGVFDLYNAIAQLPESGPDVKWSNFFMRDVSMTLTHLEATPFI